MTSPVPFTPGDTSKIVVALVDLYRQAEADLIALMAEHLATGIDAPDWVTRQLMEVQRYRRAAQQVVASLGGGAVTAGAAAVDLAAGQAAATGLADIIRRATPDPAGLVGTPLNVDRLSTIAADLARVTSTTNATVLRQTDDIYRRVIADVVRAEATGVMSRRQAAEKALQHLTRAGVTGFVDKAGRRWELASYVEAASRAATMNSAIEGYAQQMQAQGHDLVIVSDVPQECAKCRPFEGRVLSLSGQVAGSITEDGKTVAGTLDSARAEGLFHPGCRHSIAMYIPGVTRSFGETADPQGDRDRQRLRALERRVRAAKREELAALTPEGKKAAAAKVRAGQAAIREHVANSTAKRQRHREQVNTAR